MVLSLIAFARRAAFAWGTAFARLTRETQSTATWEANWSQRSHLVELFSLLRCENHAKRRIDFLLQDDELLFLVVG